MLVDSPQATDDDGEEHRADEEELLPAELVADPAGERAA